MGIELIESLIGENQEIELKELLDQQPGLVNEITSTGVSPLLLAAYYKKFNLVALIATYIQNLSFFDTIVVGNTNLITTYLNQDPELINTFSDDGFTAIGLACLFGNLEVAEVLVAHNADLNLPTNNGFNVFPLHSACASNNLPLVKFLIRNHAKVSIQQSAGLTPLHIASELGNVEMIIELLENGADITIRMEGGKLPADVALEKGHVEISEILRD